MHTKSSKRLERLPELEDLYQLYEEMWAVDMKALSRSSRNVVEMSLLHLIYGFKVEYSLRDDPKTVPRNVSDTRHLLAVCAFLHGSPRDGNLRVEEVARLCPGFPVIVEDQVSNDRSDLLEVFTHYGDSITSMQLPQCIGNRVADTQAFRRIWDQSW